MIWELIMTSAWLVVGIILGERGVGTMIWHRVTSEERDTDTDIDQI